MDKGSIVDGASYFFRGVKLLSHPRLRWFILIPILINTLVFLVLTTVLVQQFSNVVGALTDWLPSWLSFIAWILSVVAALFAIFLYGYFFSLITNLLAAPFYGILAEKVECLLTGEPFEGEALWKMIPRTFLRELVKLWYFIWRGLIVLILSFVPLFGQAIGIVWGSWSMTVQYTDYAADNHQWHFSRCRQYLRAQIWSSLGFGSIVIIGLMIPIVNIIVPTAAVIGGTVFWLDERD